MRPTRDMGTYHVRIELKNGDGWIAEWRTGWRLTHGTADTSPLSAQWIAPTYEDEDDLVRNAVFMHEQGNYSCDCNKRLFLASAHQRDEPEDNPCGDTMPIARITVIRPDRTEIVAWEAP